MKKYTEEEQKIRAHFYSFTKDELKKVYQDFAAVDNFSMMKLALEILEQDKNNLVVLPVKRAYEILTASNSRLHKSLKNSPKYNANTLSLIHFELKQRKNTTSSPSSNLSGMNFGCIGSLSIMSIILIAIVMVLITALGALLMGILDFGSIFIKTVAH